MSRPLEPGEAEQGAHALEAWNWAKAKAPSEPGAWQVLSAQYEYKKYGTLPSGGRPGWEHGGGGGAYGWELKDGDLVPKDRSWFEKYGGLAVTLGVLTAGTASAFVGGGAAGTAGSAASLGPSTSANLAATAGIVGGGGVPSSLAAGGSTALAGLSYGDLLKYGLPVAGNLVGGLIQAKASTAANDAQQKYLEEALAYQKEQDAYTRTRQSGLDAQEVQRYGAYQNRISPFIQNGTSSNDRMAALLGLPARSGSSGGGESGDPISYADRLSAADKLKVDAELKAANSNDNPAYWYGVNAQHGGFDATGADWNHQRISTGDGVGKGYVGAGAPSTAGASPAGVSAPSPASVQMRAPDGSVKTVPADQVDFYKQRGAMLLQGAA